MKADSHRYGQGNGETRANLPAGQLRLAFGSNSCLIGVIRLYLCLCIVAASAAAGGCRAVCPAPSLLAKVGPGRVRIHWPACRTLQVAAHSCRRDEENHLVVRLRLRNTSARPYTALIRVEFADRDGNLEKGAERVDRQVFAPGESPPIEYSSRSDTAVSYVVDVRSARGFPWF